MKFKGVSTKYFQMCWKFLKYISIPQKHVWLIWNLPKTLSVAKVLGSSVYLMLSQSLKLHLVGSYQILSAQKIVRIRYLFKTLY